MAHAPLPRMCRFEVCLQVRKTSPLRLNPYFIAYFALRVLLWCNSASLTPAAPRCRPLNRISQMALIAGRQRSKDREPGRPSRQAPDPFMFVSKPIPPNQGTAREREGIAACVCHARDQRTKAACRLEALCCPPNANLLCRVGTNAKQDSRFSRAVRQLMGQQRKPLPMLPVPCCVCGIPLHSTILNTAAPLPPPPHRKRFPNLPSASHAPGSRPLYVALSRCMLADLFQTSQDASATKGFCFGFAGRWRVAKKKVPTP
jgi:hypothetical protein